MAIVLILTGFFLILILIRLVSQLPTSAEASKALLTARGYQLLGRTEDAIEACRSAIRLDCDDPDPHLLLAQLLMESGRQAEADSHLRLADQLERFNIKDQKSNIKET